MTQLTGIVILVWLLAPIYYVHRKVKSGEIGKDLAIIAYAGGLGLSAAFISLLAIFIAALGMVFGVVV